MIHFSSLREFMVHLRGRDLANKSTWLPRASTRELRETSLIRGHNASPTCKQNFASDARIAREITASSKRQP